MSPKGSGAMSPTLIEVKTKCPVAKIECVIMRPGYSTPQKGMIRCPHCKEMHVFHLPYDPKEVYKHEAPKEKA